MKRLNLESIIIEIKDENQNFAYLGCYKAPIYLVLVHYPIQNRKGEVVCTSVTNLDISDISRSARTYGIWKYFIVTPLSDQRELVQKVLHHWNDEVSRSYHGNRAEALEVLQTASSFQEVLEVIEQKHHQKPRVVLTDARESRGQLAPKTMSLKEYRCSLETMGVDHPPQVLVLGTGWGLAPEFYELGDLFLEPIQGPIDLLGDGAESYNHLSVRAAAAILLDRLLGRGV